MKRLAISAFVAGVGVVLFLVAREGAGAVWRAATALGLGGFAVLLAAHLGLIALMGGAWFLLARGRADARPGRFVWGRLIRESAAEALPFSAVGGYVAGARAATLAGVAGPFAAGSTVVDVTLELLAQLGYTLLGLTLLSMLRPGDPLALPMLAGVAVMALLATGFVAVQARGAGFLARQGARLRTTLLGSAGAPPPDRPGSPDGVAATLTRLYRRPGTLATAAAVHLCCWCLSGLENWLTLQLMGAAVPVAAAITIDSLLYGLRSAAFVMPAAAGVQEGGLVLLGGLFGIDADTALALSFIRRSRDLTLALPALLAWQLLEGGRAWARDQQEE